jgi:hypothetical protein
MKFFNTLTTVQKSLVVAILSIILFFVSTGLTYSMVSKNGSLISSKNSSTSLPTPGQDLAEDPNEPHTEVCPLDGDMHTKKASDEWTKKRPLAVMIENHEESRPQSGLTSADVVYETVAEGGITRFMAVFYCTLSDTQVGPVRSARTYFLDWLSEYDALYAHVGGANTPGPADALGQIIKYDIRDLNQFSIGFPTFWRDYQRLGHPVATEHTMYSTTKKLWEVGAKRNWTATDETGAKWDASFVSWKFKDPAAGGTTTKINVSFWDGQPAYAVEWNYDATCNCYKRNNGGVAHMDLNNNQQIGPKNLVVRFMTESRANDGYEGNAHLIYGNKGTGRALIFQDGKVIEGTWNKASRVAREKFMDITGKEIVFNRGQIWLEAVPEGANVSY